MKLPLMALLACLFCTGTNANADVFKSKWGYHITIPSSWLVENEPFNADVKATGPIRNDYAPLFRTTILNTSPSLNTLQKIKRDNARTLPNLYKHYKLHRSFYNKVGGLTALVSDESQATDDGERARFLHAIVLRQGKTIIFTWTAMDKQFPMYKATFQKMLDSVRWVK